MKKTILEFNEEQQMFHYNDVINNAPKDAENRLGWKTLIVCESDKEASLFADFLQVQFLAHRKARFVEMEKTLNNLTRFLSKFCEL